MGYATVFVGRSPPPKDLVGRTLFALGSLLRGTGRALDSIGAAVEGPYATKDPLVPNTAWMPFPANKDVTPPAGITPRAIPAHPGMKDAPRLDIVAPLKGKGVWVAQNATVIGNVKIGDNSSIWYGAVLRGDVNAITIGSNTNLQDNVTVHVARAAISGEPRATVVGNNVTVAHGATLHACTVGDGCLVGMGATLLDGVVMEPGSIVAAGAVVPPGSVVKRGQVWAGSPAKLLRVMTPEEGAFVAGSASNYAALATEHAIEAGKAFEEVVLDQQIASEKLWRNRTDIDVRRGILRDPDTQVIISMR